MSPGRSRPYGWAFVFRLCGEWETAKEKGMSCFVVCNAGEDRAGAGDCGTVPQKASERK